MNNEELIDLIRQGINVHENIGALYSQNMGIIQRLALEISGKFTDNQDSQNDLKEELEQEAYFGLLKAVEAYDPAEGTRFMTYAAHWLKAEMYRYCDETTGPVRIPSNRRGQVRKYRSTVARVNLLLGRSPSDQELCALLSVNHDALEEIRKASAAGYSKSMDTPLEEGDDSGETFGDLIPDNHEDPMEGVLNTIHNQELAEVLWPMVDNLPDQQSFILHEVYQGGKSVQEAGQAIGMSRGQARNERQKALAALRRGPNGAKLEAYHSRLCYSYGLKGGIGRWRRTSMSSTEEAAIKVMELMEKAMEPLK